MYTVQGCTGVYTVQEQQVYVLGILICLDFINKLIKIAELKSDIEK